MNRQDQLTTRRRTTSSLGIIAIGSAALMLMSSGTASAAVPGLELHRSTSANNSTSKSTTAACPSGKTLTGVGGDITGGAGAVVIDDLASNAARTQNLTTGYEVEPSASQWYLHSYAICADPLAGGVRIVASTPSNGTDLKSVTARCPAGTQLTGASGQINGAVGNVVMDDLRPNGAVPNGVTVTGAEIDPEASWSATAIALCANPLPGLVRVTATSASNSSNKSATATCPRGKKLVGLGGELNGATGEVVIDDYRPSEFLTGATVTGNEAVDLDGAFGGNWTVTAYAICATA